MLAHSNELRIRTPRWLKAQEYERGFWQRLGDSIESGTREHLDWYNWRARRLEQRLASIAAGPLDGKTLEIGSGPIGIVNFLGWGERYAIDPLEHFYSTRPSLVALRKPDVTYLDGTGERLPFEKASFSLVIIDNVIDHTYAPERILREIHRVLGPDGQLYLSVNVHTRWGALLHDLLARLQIDKGHPFTFTSRTLRQLLAANQFQVIHEEVEDYEQAKRADRESTRLTGKIKGFTGLSEFSHSVICRRQPSDTASKR
jgi:SAM-dependent methyltransferase